jgi:hypothetical protein
MYSLLLTEHRGSYFCSKCFAASKVKKLINKLDEAENQQWLSFVRV